MRTHHLVRLGLALGALTSAGCAKPTGENIPLDATKDCASGVVTIHYPRAFVATDPQPGLCAIEPNAESGFGAQTGLIVTVVEGPQGVDLDRAVAVFTQAYAQKPGWVPMTNEKKKCFKDIDGVEITGTLTEGTETVEMRICSFLHAGRVLQITTSSAKDRDGALLARLRDAVELHELPAPASSSSP